jgi:hypothetical protein
MPIGRQPDSSWRVNPAAYRRASGLSDMAVMPRSRARGSGGSRAGRSAAGGRRAGPAARHARSPCRYRVAGDVRDPGGVSRREEDRAVPRGRLRAHAPTVRLGAGEWAPVPKPRRTAPFPTVSGGCAHAREGPEPRYWCETPALTARVAVCLTSRRSPVRAGHRPSSQVGFEAQRLTTAARSDPRSAHAAGRSDAIMSRGDRPATAATVIRSGR